MDDYKIKRKDNGVKENLNQGFSPGRESHARQVAPDHQPATGRKHQTKKLEKEKLKRQKIKIGTWNVRTLFQTGKLSNVISEMRRMELNILGLAESRWTDCGNMI